MKYIIIPILMMVSITLFGQSVEDGKVLFDTNCKACHSLGKGRLVGPDLAGITERRNVEWIGKFITNSSALIASGDEEAKAVFEEYNSITMPAHPFDDTQLKNLVTYLGSYDAKAEQEIGSVESTEPEALETLESSVAVPLWIKLFLSGTIFIVIALLATIFILMRLIKGI